MNKANFMLNDKEKESFKETLHLQSIPFSVEKILKVSAEPNEECAPHENAWKDHNLIMSFFIRVAII